MPLLEDDRAAEPRSGRTQLHDPGRGGGSPYRRHAHSRGARRYRLGQADRAAGLFGICCGHRGLSHAPSGVTFSGSDIMTVETSVAEHYSHGSLEHAILTALEASGKNLAQLTPADLAPVDEFHVGGRQATVEFMAQLGFKLGMRLLDIGCGI